MIIRGSGHYIGVPVQFVVPDLHDFQQAQAVAKLAVDYLGLSFSESELLAFPAQIRAMWPDFLAELEQQGQANESIALLLS